VSGLVPVRIAGTGTVPAGRAVSTAELVARLGQGDVAAIEAKTGIVSRWFAEPGDTAARRGGGWGQCPTRSVLTTFPGCPYYSPAASTTNLASKTPASASEVSFPTFSI
jgi:hypothetical protein